MHRIAAIVAAGAIGLSGAGLAACGDDDNEGPAEEAGKAVDDAGNEAGQELEEAGKDADQEIGDDDGKSD
jgi:hypothetical protein